MEKNTCQENNKKPKLLNYTILQAIPACRCGLVWIPHVFRVSAVGLMGPAVSKPAVSLSNLRVQVWQATWAKGESLRAKHQWKWTITLMNTYTLMNTSHGSGASPVRFWKESSMGPFPFLPSTKPCDFVMSGTHQGGSGMIRTVVKQRCK